MARDFVFTWEDQEFWVDDLTLAESMELEQTIGEWPTWQPIRNAKVRFTLMTMFLRRAHSEDEVAKVIGDMTLGSSLTLWELREQPLPEVYEDGLPLAEAGASTST